MSFSDGSATERVEVEYPLGHRRRRAEGLPRLEEKFQANLASCLPSGQCRALLDLFRAPEQLETLPVDRFMDMLSIS